MVEGSVAWIVATLAGNTVIIASALCRGVSAMNTNCLSTVEFEDGDGKCVRLPAEKAFCCIEVIG